MLSLLLFDDWQDTCYVLGPKINRRCAEKVATHDVSGLYYGQFLKNADSDRNVLNRLSEYALSNDIPVYGHDHVKSISGGFVSENFSVIEDGLGNYRTAPPRPRRILPNNGTVIPFGYDPRIKRVYLTARLPIPELLKDKVIVFNMAECWKRKSAADQSAILDIFSVPMEKLTGLIDQGRDQLFLTQPMYIRYSGAARAAVREKLIAFYKKILERYDKSRVIIKVHPAEKLDYQRYFPDYVILKDPFPLELMVFSELGRRIDRLISINSSANYGVLDDDKVDTYAAEWTRFLKTGEL